jgi:hypothetical protein
MYQQGRDKSRASGSRAGDAFWKEEAAAGNFGLRMMSQMGWEQGKGLGKNEDGTKQYLRAKYKADAKGIGADGKTEDATWLATQDLFTQMLQRVKAEQVAAASSPTGSPQAEESVEESESTLTTTDPSTNTTTVLRQHIQKRTLYGRFKKAKDTSSYSSKAMSEIFGRKDVVPSGPWGNTPAITSNGNGSAAAAADVKSEDSKIKVKQEDAAATPELQSTSKLSIRDYFAAKLAAAGKLGGMSAAQFANKTETQVKQEEMDREDDERHGGLGLGHSAAAAAAPSPSPAPAGQRGFSESQQEDYYARMMASAIGGKGVQTGRSARVGLGFGGAGYGGNQPGGVKQSALLTAKRAIKIDLDDGEAAVVKREGEKDVHQAASPVAAYEEELVDAAAVDAAPHADGEDDKASKKAKKSAKKARKEKEAAAEAAAAAEAEAAQAAAASAMEIDGDAQGDDEEAAKAARKAAKKAAKREAAAAAQAAAEAEAAAATAAAAAAAAASAASAADEAEAKAAKKARKAEKRRREAEEQTETGTAAAAAVEPEAEQQEEQPKKKKKKAKD